MNEQRLQAYYQLIESLLNCPSGEEPAILADNTELLDAGFLQVLEAVAENFSQQGEENAANWFRYLANKLSAALNSPSTTVPSDSETPLITAQDLEAYKQFLLEVLRATADSNGDAQVVYPLLAANTDKLNHIFAELLRGWATNTLAEAEADFALSIARVIGNFSILVSNFPLGSKASNIEITITGYEIALTVLTRNAFPQDWARTQNHLGNAYSDRILGERAENLELAITAFRAALEIRTRNTFPQDWARTQNNLGAAYFYRILGERAENLELAITAFRAALEVDTRNAFPQDWAGTQNNLGNAYRNRILGERAKNLELAITAFRAALEVDTRNAFPQDWAMTQNNLGTAYFYRILGERAENLELAIAAYRAALQVYTRNAFPQDWAMTQNNLGAAYSERILGERAENLELAIAAYRAALEVRTKNAFPQDWAGTQNNLGNAYSERILGERAENLELAIAAYRAALEVRTKNAFPQDWAGTQNNLGNAYSERILGERAENLELAIAAYRAALQVYTRNAFPQDWAGTQNNLGTAYRNRILGERAENLELAITAFRAALEVRTRNAFPQDWARTQNNLGSVYLYRTLGERAENLELAIAAFCAALEIRTRNAFPQDWAMTQNNLGSAYGNRILGERAENLELEIAAFCAALEVRTRNAFPQNHAETLLNLGITYQKTEQFNLAYSTFVAAITTVESLRGDIFSGEDSKRKQAEEWNQLYRRMVKVCLELGKITEAIEYVERSKTRSLVERILDRDLKTIFPPEVVPRLEQLRDEIASGQYQLQNGKAENPTALAQHLQELRQQRQELLDQYLPIGSGFKFDSFQTILDNRTAIIEWYITGEKVLAFVIKPNGQTLTFCQSQPEELSSLFDWVVEYLGDYTQKEQWQNQLGERLKRLADILLIEEILTLIPKHCDRLILIPHRFLHLFPLHALPVQESYLLDLFPNGVGYAPSCQLLQQVQLRERPDFESLFAIQNPTKDLYQDYEKDLGAVAAIKKQFTDTEILKQGKAKKSAILHVDQNTNDVTLNEKLLNAHCAFFFCHGYFNFESPLDSGLQLADDDLTLAEIIAYFKLESCRLVTLSACETGFTDFTSTSDEYIGLPSGFLLAGSTNVVSSLWTVSATATALLMIKFYEELQQQSNITLALNTAQRWLRDTTVKGFQDWLSNSPLLRVWQTELYQAFDKMGVNPETAKPFESPYYWSGFCAIGKGG